MKNLLVFTMVLVFTIAASATVILVPQQYPTIQAGVDAAQPGDTVQVAPGVYSPVKVAFKDNISLFGSGMFGANATTIANGNVDGIAATHSNGLIIRGFEITNVHRGVHFYLYCDNCEVSETYVHDCDMYYSDGVSVNTCNYVYIHHNVYAFTEYTGAVVNNSSNVRFYNNTIVYSLPSGNGILFNQFCQGLEVVNNIVAFNGDEGVESVPYQSGANISYNDNYANGGNAWQNVPVGNGNIYSDPLFISIGDCPYSISSNSPCKDTGDPSILDPDGSVSDIGAIWTGYFGGGAGVLTMDLSPLNPPIILPPAGGTVTFDVLITCEDDYRLFDGWYDLELPDGQIISPMLLREDLYLAPGASITRQLELEISALSMSGEYEVLGYVGDYPDSVDAQDAFTFTKSAANGLNTNQSSSQCSISGWGGTEYFEIPVIQPDIYELSLSASPNPFNPQTTISFDLPAGGEISLKIFDSLGREVQTLVTGHLPLGKHSVVWEAGDKASGLYFVQLSQNGRIAVDKILLVK